MAKTKKVKKKAVSRIEDIAAATKIITPLKEFSMDQSDVLVLDLIVKVDLLNERIDRIVAAITQSKNIKGM